MTKSELIKILSPLPDYEIQFHLINETNESTKLELFWCDGQFIFETRDNKQNTLPLLTIGLYK